ncbi:hypothetical protein ACFQH2_12330 [Natronoarchaeum sp. GCM10025703]|uniref:hypothetical protein n=1 Tax=Natronoarchaeum sp. GCM10025703 TaxID=3252685 RepID=UPI00360FB0C6
MIDPSSAASSASAMMMNAARKPSVGIVPSTFAMSSSAKPRLSITDASPNPAGSPIDAVRNTDAITPKSAMAITPGSRCLPRRSRGLLIGTPHEEAT